VALFAQSCSNEEAENDWTRDKLHGKVLSFSEFSYKAVDRFGNIEKGKRERAYTWKKDEQRKYDYKGNKIEENSYNSDGSLDSKWTYKYDDKGNQIELNSYNSDGSLSIKWTYKYDDKGNKIEENSYNSDGSLISKWTFIYEFDKQGNWIKRIDFKNEIPEFILEREYEYYN
jgi:hypothetical protein